LEAARGRAPPRAFGILARYGGHKDNVAAFYLDTDHAACRQQQRMVRELGWSGWSLGVSRIEIAHPRDGQEHSYGIRALGPFPVEHSDPPQIHRGANCLNVTRAFINSRNQAFEQYEIVAGLWRID
jgi:hypothetical protein